MKFVPAGNNTLAEAGIFATPVFASVSNVLTEETWSNDFRPGYYLDALCWNGFGLEMPLGLLPIRQLLGWIPKPDDGIIYTSRYKPQTERTYGLGKDKLRYETFLSVINTFVTGGDPTIASPRADSWYRETDTVHSTARGTFLYGTRGSDVYPTIGIRHQMGKRLPAFEEGGTGNPDLAYCFPYILAETTATGLVFTHLDAAELLQVGFQKRNRILFRKEKSLKSGHAGQSVDVFGYAVNYLRWNPISADLSIQDGSFSCVLKYLFENYATSTRASLKSHKIPESTAKYEVTLVISCSLSDPGVYNLGNAGIHRIAMVPHVEMSVGFNLKSYDCNIALPSDYPWHVSTGTAEPTFQTIRTHLLSKPGTTVEGLSGFWDDVRVRYPDIRPVDRPMIRFRDWVASVHDQYRDTAALSANDALSTYSSSSNFLESIPELPSILSYVDNILDFARFFNKAAHGDPRAFTRLVDALASAYLAYQYGVKPNLSDRAEAQRIAHGLANGLIGQFDGSSLNLYGKFSYSPTTDGLGMRGDVTLTTRTKMVIVNDAEGLLAMLLTLNQVGLLPTLARIWDLVPFSFVLDWFTNLGDRFEYLDNTVLRHGIHLSYYLHTFEYRFTPGENKSHPYWSDGNEDQPCWVVYRRERSLFHPLIKDGTKDYYPRKSLSIQKLAIASSLLWVLK